MWEKIKQILKSIYLKIGCSLCCKSKCSVQLGKENEE